MVVNSKELKKHLAKQGCRFETQGGGSGHIWAMKGNRRTILPMHGSRKELPKGTVNRILKDLGLK